MINMENEETEVEDLNAMKKFNDFSKLWDFYHVERCEHVDCSNYLFIVNLRNLFVQNGVHEQDLIVPLKHSRRMKIKEFNCFMLFLKTLGALKKTSFS